LYSEGNKQLNGDNSVATIFFFAPSFDRQTKSLFSFNTHSAVMSISYLIGVDGGGSKTIAYCVDSNAQVKGNGTHNF
jgi:hypothetical protein